MGRGMICCGATMKKKKIRRIMKLRKAAMLAGSVAAVGSMTMCSSVGDGLSFVEVEEAADVAQNVQTVRAEASNNNRDAQFNLGCCYLNG